LPLRRCGVVGALEVLQQRIDNAVAVRRPVAQSLLPGAGARAVSRVPAGAGRINGRQRMRVAAPPRRARRARSVPRAVHGAGMARQQKRQEGGRSRYAVYV